MPHGFSNSALLPGPPSEDNHAATKGYVDGRKNILFGMDPVSVRRSIYETPVTGSDVGTYTKLRVTLGTASTSGSVTVALYKNRSTTAHDTITLAATATQNNKTLATNLVLAEGDTVTIGITAAGTNAVGLAAVIS